MWLIHPELAALLCLRFEHKSCSETIKLCRGNEPIASDGQAFCELLNLKTVAHQCMAVHKLRAVMITVGRRGEQALLFAALNDHAPNHHHGPSAVFCHSQLRPHAVQSGVTLATDCTKSCKPTATKFAALQAKQSASDTLLKATVSGRVVKRGEKRDSL